MKPATGPRVLLALGLGLLAACSPSPKADLVVLGRTWTGDSALPWAEAVAMRGDTIIAVGKRDEVARVVGNNTMAIDNPDGLIVPGFMDGHTHFISGGRQLANVDLRSATTPTEFVRRVKEFAARQPAGEWITGGDWDHELWPGTPLPRRDWIDSVTPNNPVLLSRLDGHLYLANTQALKLAGIGRDHPRIPGGVIVKDPKTGEPTGALKDNAADSVSVKIPPYTAAQQDEYLQAAMRFAVSKGLTGISDMSEPEDIWNDLAAYRRAHDAGKMLLRVTLYPPLPKWRAIADTVARAGHGDEWFQILGLKGFVDGSLGSRTALFFEPYADDPTTSGLFRTPEDSLRAWIGAGDSAGLQIAVHAIGERGNALILSIYDSVAHAHGPRDRRFRVEHAQHLRSQEIARFGTDGVIASMQAIHLVDDGSWAIKRLGPRVNDTYVFKSLLDHGARLQFGSDWTVAPLDPILGIAAAVTRHTRDGKNPDGWLPQEKITVEQALHAYTAANAYGVFAEHTRGRIKVGYRADLTVLDHDLFKIPPAAIESVTVRATVAGGKVVYKGGGRTVER
ncbi:MAG TPA: amidohydrolase [Gemmatimonadales bacterium]|nr:amidohydrolase [Gemmatimonadales bacterium]